MNGIDRRLEVELGRAAGRWRHVRVVTAWAAAWLVLGLGAGAAILAGWTPERPWGRAELTAALVVLGGLAVAIGRWASRPARDLRRIARRIERWRPALDSRLLAAIEQRAQPPRRRLGYLQETLIRETLADAWRHDWRRAIPARRLVLAHAAHGAAAVLLGLAAAGLFFHAGPLAPRDGRGPLAAMLRAAGLGAVQVEPGDVQVERGESVLVVARFPAPAPPRAWLVVAPLDAAGRRLAMTRGLDDPLFGRRIERVESPMTYRVAYPGGATRWFRIDVFDYPRLEQLDARITYPDYLQRPEELIPDTLRLAVVEGARVRLSCRLNKPVDQAWLEQDGGPPLTLLPDAPDSVIYEGELTVERSRRLRLRLLDRQGRSAKETAELVIEAIPNRPPQLKVVRPGGDVRVSPLEELALEASAWDDFGLVRYGVAWSLGGAEPEELVLGEGAGAAERRVMRRVLAFESLHAQPGQLASYYFWAEDRDARGRLRRALSDMYFAEVRPFDEIFRQGQPPPGGQDQQQRQRGGAQQDAERLAELQKQIVAGVWNVIRRETGGSPSPKLAEDAALLRDSQAEAIAQGRALGERLQDAESLGHVTRALDQMERARSRLAEAAQGDGTTAPLPAALAAAQAAYQDLLGLRAREHRVARARRPGGASRGASPRAQQQLQQLQLDPREPRYETQRTAAAQENPLQREMRQALSRLRELAQRQQDVNQRLRELQSALRQAASDEEREEVRRQLQRLRDRQRDILEDVDELDARMQRPENREAMRDARQQLRETRSQVRRAAEALREGMMSQAETAGARAGRRLEQLRDEFRRRAAGQFSETMRRMREDARALDQQQQELGRRLAQWDPRRPPDPGQTGSLRGPDSRRALGEALEQQKKRLEQLLQDMQRTVQEAEGSEPLLSNRLYDAWRQAAQEQADQDLDAARYALDRGLVDAARSREQQAQQAIERLRRGVERAAESVLGDEAEALRRAGDEVAELARQVREEIDAARRAAPSRSPTGRPDAEQPAEPEPSPAGGRPPSRGNRPTDEASAQTARTAQLPGQQARQRAGREPPQAGPEANQPTGGAGPNEPRSETTPPAEPRSEGRGQRAGRPQGGADPRGGAAGRDQQDGPGGLWNQLVEQGGQRVARPLTGDAFPEWSDRLRDVEELVEDPELRAEAARIRQRARSMRREMRRHAAPPNWDLVERLIAQPLVELQERIAEQLRAKSGEDPLAPVDRDPTPDRFADQVRRYFESLSSGE